MTHRSGILSLVAALLLTSVAAPAVAATSTGVLSGTVRSSATGEPAADVRVCAGSRTVHVCQVTDEDGTYAMRLKRDGYIVRARDASIYGTHVQAQANHGKPVRLEAHRTVDFSLLPGASISGRLRPGGGDPPHPAFTVRAYGVKADGAVAMTSTGMSNIGPTGYFVVTQLPAGRWVLSIGESDRPPLRWFGATSVASAAPRFDVTTGQSIEVGDTDFGPTGTLRVRPTFRGHTVEGDVQIFDEDGRRVSVSFPDRDRRTGAYAFPGLAVGTYRIKIAPGNVAGYREWFGGRSAETARRVTVTAEGVTRQDTPVHPPRLRATRRPSVRLGGFAEIVGLRWNVPSRSLDSVQYSWYRDRHMIDRHIGDGGHMLSDRDVGHRLRVCILAGRKGYVDGTVCSRYTRKVTWDDFGRG